VKHKRQQEQHQVVQPCHNKNALGANGLKRTASTTDKYFQRCVMFTAN